jgi:hypothetical protein
VRLSARTTKPAPKSANPNTALSLGRAERANADKSRLIGVLDARREGNEAAAVPHSLSLTGIHLLSSGNAIKADRHCRD